MVCFTSHYFTFSLELDKKWCELLEYFYPNVQGKTSLNEEKKTKTVVYNSIWRGSGQKSALPEIPSSFFEIPSSEEKIDEERLKDLLNTWEGICSIYKSGIDLGVAGNFETPIESDTILDNLVHYLCFQLGTTKLKRGYHLTKSNSYILQDINTNHLVLINKQGMFQGSDICVDLDDGVTLCDDRVLEEDQNQTNQDFEDWVAKGRPLEPILKWTKLITKG